MSFEKYWEENKSRFMEIAKNEFEKIQKGKFVGIVEINTDDDFSLDCGNSIEIFANTKSELTKKLIETLKNAKLTYCKTWSTRTNNDSEVKRGDYSHAWFSIRDEAIKNLKAGEDFFSYGGNQTISVEILETTPQNIKSTKNKL